MPVRPSADVTPAASRLAHDLACLLALADGRSLSIERVLTTMEDRGYALTLLFLAFPFVLPIPSLGMSAPIGFCLALTGLALARGGTPPVPDFLRRREIAYPALKAIAASVDRVRRVSALLMRPRLRGVTSGPARAAIGLSLCCAAIVLALPIPLPLSNFFPAAAILLLALGLIESDGLLVMAGHAATVAVCVVLYVAWGAALMGIDRVLAWVI
jgi:hypothetical protein